LVGSGENLIKALPLASPALSGTPVGNPLETGLVYNVDSINRFNLLKILLIMRNSKLFINGGGSLIQDNTSTRSLIYYLGMIWLAKKWV